VSDVYYNPEQYGLMTVGEISFDDDSYQFDMGVVWWHPERHVFFYAEDSGCSCPPPFEDFYAIESLGQPLDLAALTAKLRTLTAKEYGSTDTPVAVQASSVIDRARDLVAAVTA
jgi:hypothetical protein